MKYARLKTMFQEARDEIHQMKKLSELIEYISTPLMSHIAFYILLLWVLSPVIILLFGWVLPASNNEVRSLRQILLYEKWYVFLIRIGIIGCFFSIILIDKSLLKAKKFRTTIFQYMNQHSLAVLLMLLLLCGLVSTLLSNNVQLSFFGEFYRKEGYITYISYAGVFTLGLLVHDMLRIRRLIITMVISSFIITIYAQYRWLSLPVHAMNIRPVSIFNNINHYGYYLCIVIILCLFLFVNDSINNTYSWAWIAVYSVLSTALMFNTSFGPYIAVISGLMFSVLFLYLMKIKGLRLRALIAIGLFIAFSIIINVQIGFLGNDIKKLTDDVNNIVIGSNTAYLAGANRWGLWKSGIQFALMKPWFGHGPENLSSLYQQFGPIDIDRPHNELIQIAATLGFPAMIFYVIGLLKHLIDFIKRWRKINILGIGIFISIATYLISSLVGNSMYYTTPFFFMLLGISYGMLRNSDADEYLSIG